jgi:hypothetical protein
MQSILRMTNRVRSANSLRPVTRVAIGASYVPDDQSSEIGAKSMSGRVIVLLAFLAALWLFGLIGQFHSAEAAMRYLALSMAILAVAVWRWQPQPALRRRHRDRQIPPG